MRSKSPSSRPPQKVFGRTVGKVAKAPPGARAGIRPALFYGCFAALFGTNVLTAVALLMAPDIAGLMGSQTDMVIGAYEDRIAELRVEVDRLHSRQYAQAGDINLQLQELSQQQEELLEQHQLVKQLAAKASELGIDTAALPADQDEAPLPVMPKGVADLAQIGATMDQMRTDSRLALASLSVSASRSTSTIVKELSRLGIKPKLPSGEDEAMGGPYIAPVDGDDAPSLVDDANGVYLALNRFKAARDAIGLAPIHKPLTNYTRQSSGFGNRSDPFTRGKAFHSGLDYAAPTGTTVYSAGYGKVTFVGERAGYGNLVEISHGAGLVTRYGHLSAFLVKQGQTVNTGTPIAKVGSTGRSTGPHLHFEVRRKDAAVDPSPFLAVGKKLQRFLGS